MHATFLLTLHIDERANSKNLTHILDAQIQCTTQNSQCVQHNFYKMAKITRQY